MFVLQLITLLLGAFHLAAATPALNSAPEIGSIDPKQCGYLAPIYPPDHDANNMKVNSCWEFVLLTLPGLDVRYIVNPDCRCKFFK